MCSKRGLKNGTDVYRYAPLSERAGERGCSSHVAVVQPRPQWPYHHADQKLSSFSSTIPSKLEKPAREIIIECRAVIEGN